MNKNIKSDPFWANDISIIWKKERLTEFFPSKDQTLEERFNSIVRLSIYCSILLYFYHNQNYKYLSIALGGLLMTYYVYNNKEVTLKKESFEAENVASAEKQGVEKQGVEKQGVEKQGPEKQGAEKQGAEKQGAEKQGAEKQGAEKEDKKKCVSPTIDNPFMNATMKDFLNVDPVTNRIVDRAEACDINDIDVKKQIDSSFNNNLYKDVNDIFGKMNSQRQFYTMPSTTIPNAQDDFAKWLYLNPKTCKEDQDFCLKYEDIRAKRPVMYNPNQNPVDTKR